MTEEQKDKDRRMSVAAMTDEQFDVMIRGALNQYPETLSHLDDVLVPTKPKRINHWEDKFGRAGGLLIALFILAILCLMVIGVSIIIIYIFLELV